MKYIGNIEKSKDLIVDFLILQPNLQGSFNIAPLGNYREAKIVGEGSMSGNQRLRGMWENATCQKVGSFIRVGRISIFFITCIQSNENLIFFTKCLIKI